MRQDDTDGLPDDPWANFAKRDCSDEIATVYETSSAINVDGLLSDPMDTSDGPTDDAILKQQNDIQEEVAKKLELIGDKETLESLAAEYSQGNPVFLSKIQDLNCSYEFLRRARGDGNCFFRSFMFSYFERILVEGNKAEGERMKNQLIRCKEALRSIGYAEFTWEDFFHSFSDQLDEVTKGPPFLRLEKLVETCKDPNVSNYVVMFLRFVTSAEIQSRSDFFEPFTIGTSGQSVTQFCQKSVEPMGEESDHIHIIALSDALQVPIRVVYLDGNQTSVNHHDFFPEGTQSTEPFVVLLYRPGHYDILYPKKVNL